MADFRYLNTSVEDGVGVAAGGATATTSGGAITGAAVTASERVAGPAQPASRAAAHAVAGSRSLRMARP